MKHFRIEYHPLDLCKAVITERLKELEIAFYLSGEGELSISEELLTDKKWSKVVGALKPYGITLIEKTSDTLVEKIKYAIEELLVSPTIRTEKMSVYLSEKLGLSYSSLANRFSEETYTSIENFIILRRIEHAKNLMLQGGTSLTEIAHRLDYSSVAHLSRQFKKTTGLTPTVFLRILKKRIIN